MKAQPSISLMQIADLGEMKLLPIGAGTVAAFVAYVGWSSINRVLPSMQSNKRISATEIIQFANMLLVLAGSALLVFTITTSIDIALSIGLLLMGIPFILARRKAERTRHDRERSWPVAIDGIVSSLQAGQSVTESINQLSEHGPDPLKPYLNLMARELQQGETFSRVMEKAMQRLNCPIADQVLVVLFFAKEFGGKDVTTTLRLLASFLRDSNQVREEVDTKFGWVRNSAVLGAIAPWLLLALLSLQPKTVEAYATSNGRMVLSIGIMATAIAFLWMGRVAKLPEMPRAFSSAQLMTRESAN